MLIHLKQRGFGIHLTTSKSPESYCVGGMCFIPLFEALMIQDLVKDWFRETHIFTPENMLEKMNILIYKIFL